MLAERGRLVCCKQWHTTRDRRRAAPRGLTLVEMLIAMAITIVMMGAVVTLFANISESVRNRRATIEMSGQLRHVRNVLQQDLAGATCPGLTWQRPESNHGYIEIIEGPYREGDASGLLVRVDDTNDDGTPTEARPRIDHRTSIIPTSRSDRELAAAGRPDWVTDGAGLGDYDDILMLTVRNEHEPFVGRVPSNVRNPNNGSLIGFANWQYGTIESTLAEVMWYAVENPGHTDPELADDPSANGFFGEPGMRTIYRRALLIAPWINPYRFVDQNGDVVDTFRHDGEDFRAEPGLVRILPPTVTRDRADLALAALIAFQDRYDLSVRLEFDPRLGNDGRYKIVANTLGDLTKRENRFGHHFFRPVESGERPPGREYPFAMVSIGSGYSGDSSVTFVTDPDPDLAVGDAGPVEAHVENGVVASYSVDPDDFGTAYRVRPFAFVEETSTTIATARAMLNDEGQVVRVIHGPVPLWGRRRGEDVMLTDALAFDLRVYDPGAPLFAHAASGNVLEPSDPGWRGTPSSDGAYMHADNMGSGAIGSGGGVFPFVGQGAYVDLGYGYVPWRDPPELPDPDFAAPASGSPPWFFAPRWLPDVYGTPLAPGYSVYDTWSFHYENNGLNEDGVWFDGSNWRPAGESDQLWRQLVDQGTDGLNNSGVLGVDGVDERETRPPYDKPLRGIQVLMRLYERDSRQIRQVRVNQHFMPE